MEYELAVIELQGMAGIGPPLKTGDDIVRRCEHIDNLAFALVTPLQAQ